MSEKINHFRMSLLFVSGAFFATSIQFEHAVAACPPDKHYFTNCSNPCLVSDCKTSPNAECRPEYCGGCVARFFDTSGKEIHCEEEEGYICEMKTNTISCASTTGTTLNIIYANYGRTSRKICEHPYGLERLHNNTECRAPSSLPVVKELCQQRVSCTITADGSLFGEDPCFGVYKYLEVDFECIKSAPCPLEKHYFTNCSNPCLVSDTGSTVCKTSPEVECRPDYCGGCVSRFFDTSGKEIHCEEEQGFICELKTNAISCADSPGATLNITYANYGRTSKEVCEHPYGLERLHNNTNCRAANSLSIVRKFCQQKVSCTLTADVSIFGEDPCYGVYKYLEVDFECRTTDVKSNGSYTSSVGPATSETSSLSSILVPCLILAIVAVLLVAMVIYWKRKKRQRERGTAISFVEMADEGEVEEEGIAFQT